MGCRVSGVREKLMFVGTCAVTTALGLRSVGAGFRDYSLGFEV